MEVGVSVSVERQESESTYTILKEIGKVCRAYLTFVAVDKSGHKRKLDDCGNILYERAIYDTDWFRRYHQAEERRKQRLGI